MYLVIHVAVDPDTGLLKVDNKKIVGYNPQGNTDQMGVIPADYMSSGMTVTEVTTSNVDVTNMYRVATGTIEVEKELLGTNTGETFTFELLPYSATISGSEYNFDIPMPGGQTYAKLVKATSYGSKPYDEVSFYNFTPPTVTITPTSGSSGTASFGKITFYLDEIYQTASEGYTTYDKATYKYLVREKAGIMEGMQYDDTAYLVTFILKADSSNPGKVNASKTIQKVKLSTTGSTAGSKIRPGWPRSTTACPPSIR